MSKKLEKYIAILIIGIVLIGCNKVPEQTINTSEQEHESGNINASLDNSTDDTNYVDLSKVGDGYFTGTGKYCISGYYSGLLTFDGCGGDVYITLDGVELTNENGNCIEIVNSAKSVIVLADNKTNILTSGVYSSEMGVVELPKDRKDAAIFSQADLFVEGNGEMTINAYINYGLNSENNVIVNSGNVIISAMNKGIEAHHYYIQNGGMVKISVCFEGVEAHHVTLNGGELTVYSNDDAINAQRIEEGGEPIIEINGGRIYVESLGDGIDSNGSIYVNGGDVSVFCTAFGCSPFDTISDKVGDLVISGGNVIGMGDGWLMQEFNHDSEQCAFLIFLGFDFPQNERIEISDSDGNILYTSLAVFSGNSILYSSSKLNKDCEYKVVVGDVVRDITMTDSVCAFGTRPLLTDYNLDN